MNHPFHQNSAMLRKMLTALIVLCSLSTIHYSFADISISEIHYDNIGTDQGEAIEITGPVGERISDWQVALYNGKNGKVYHSRTLNNEFITVPGCQHGYILLHYPSNGLQNGTADGIALVRPNGSIAEFISYEGALVATDGPASGLVSVDIGVVESSKTPIGYSLQKLDGQWQNPQPAHFGRCRNAQPSASPAPSASPEPTPTIDPSPAPSITPIHAIQGVNANIAVTGKVTIEALVTADFQNSDQLKGFFVQEEDTDADNHPQSSEAIFIYCGRCPTQVAVGDKVQVTGNAQDYQGMSQISAQQVQVLAQQQALPKAIPVALPINATSAAEIDAFYEALEGMLVQFNSTLTITDTYNLGRYGELLLAHGGKIRQFTDISLPSAARYSQHLLDTKARTVLLDDGSTQQNRDPVYYPRPGFDAENYLRGGDSLNGLTGVMHYAFSAWRVQPVESLFSYHFTRTTPRPSAPQLTTGDLSIASFNVLNYFSSIDNSTTKCGPNKNLDCRGADSAQELVRQQHKITAALCAMDSDIIGLMEIENDQDNQALDSLVQQVNSQCGPYQAILTGALGNDAIRVGMIYKPARVTAVGQTAVLDSQDFLNPNLTGRDKNRPALAQSFKLNSHQKSFTVVVNHLKSKGSNCADGIDPNDDDLSAGQGNCNGTRTRAALAEIDWLKQYPTGITSDDVLVIGDLNAYRYEDPISAFKRAGYIDVIDSTLGSKAYSYVFKGAWGYLDHALASPSFAAHISAVNEWHINADESRLLDYNEEFKPEAYATALYTDSPWRSSDHDPVIISFEFGKDQPTLTDLIAQFNRYQQHQLVEGNGTWHWQKHWNIKIFTWVLHSAQHFQQKHNHSLQCQALNWLSRHSNSQQPRDRISGSKTTAINSTIAAIQTQSNCL